MEHKGFFDRMEKAITDDNRSIISLISYVIVFLIFINVTSAHSTILGVSCTLVFFLINSIFIGKAFFSNERAFVKVLLGSFLLIALLGLVSWATMVIYNLDETRSTVALFIVATTASITNKLNRHDRNTREQELSARQPNIRSYVPTVLYLFLTGLLLYLLILARSEEIYTVWQYMHPMLMPVYFLTTLLLLITILSPVNLRFKLLFVIIHSILTHSFFIIIFPAGDISGQQIVLGRTRLVFDNVIMDGWPPTPVTNVLERIYRIFGGINFQTAFSVIFARMLYVDVLWTHLLLIPVLYGTFIPISAFLTTKALGANEKMSVLSALLVSLFPAIVAWGTYSVPNSLGYVFFTPVVPFCLEYLSSRAWHATRNAFLMILFSVLSFLGHALSGIISFSLLLLALTLKRYENERRSSPYAAKASLLIVLILCTSLVPFALIYQKIFYPIYTYFSLANIYELPALDFMLLALFGQIIEFQLTTALVYVAAPLAGIISIVYVLFRSAQKGSNKTYRTCIVFLFLGMVMFVVQHRILTLFMTGVPFAAGRLWLFRDFTVVPFVGVFVDATIGFLHKKTLNALNYLRSSLANYSVLLGSRRLKAFTLASALLILYLSAFFLVSGWITVSLHRAYPHYAPLQTTTYELEAVQYIQQTTEERYIVICDQWFIFAAEIRVGINNPDAYYFAARDPRGISLFVEMKREPTEANMANATKYSNASIVYFVIEKPRLGSEEYYRVRSQALQNGLQTYQLFFHQGEEKIAIFYYKKSPTEQ